MMEASRRRLLVRRSLAAWLALAAPPLAAGVCNVPSGGYPTIAAALADSDCDPIQVASGTFVESLVIGRTVTISGAGSGSSTILGWLQVTGPTTEAALDALRLDASGAMVPLCSGVGLDVRAGAKASGADLVVVGGEAPLGACVLFADGFESGDVSAWSGGGA